MNHIRNASWLFLLFTGLLFVSTQTLLAQGSVSLSVTPTLFDISVDPGQRWQSSVRIINPNTEPLTVFAEPVNFAASGERGISTFYRLEEAERAGTTLAEWINLPEQSLTVEPQSTGQLQFQVQVPEDAAPGGQYAALLISTEPTTGRDPGSQVRTTQAVSSLFFMQVTGDVVEEGRVRSFRTSQRFVDSPQNEFILRFENQGTVHLQPQGEITIYNMWGQPRGEIPINQRTQFGKVLPEDIRSFSFGWEGAFSLLDIGRYRAEVTLAYGDQARAFTSAETTFWVIPLTGLLIVFGSLLLVIVVATWLIRRYIRRVLLLSGADIDSPYRMREHSSDIWITTDGEHVTHKKDAKNINQGEGHPSWTAPLIAILHDWQKAWNSAGTMYERQQAVLTTIRNNYILVLSFVFIGLLVFVVIFFTRIVMDNERTFEITISSGDADEVVNSEELQWEKIRTAAEEPTDITLDTTTLAAVREQEITIRIVNVSGTPGLAAALAYELSEYVPEDLISLGIDLERTERRSIVLFTPSHTQAAQQLSRALNGALLSSYPNDQTPEADITILIGSDVLP